MHKPTVTVVMPSLNQAQHIEAAVQSVFQQDYENVSLLIIDGGSSDGTLHLLEKMLEEYGSKITWISEQDAGPACAINKGFNQARGDIIGWLNSDDMYAPGAIGRAVHEFESSQDYLMVYGGASHIDVNGDVIVSYPTLPPSVELDKFQDGCFICQPSVFFRKEFFHEIGYLDETLATAFDFEIWLRAFKKCQKRIGFVDVVQAFSRLHRNTITNQQRIKVAVEAVNILQKHLGEAKPHWIMTAMEELYLDYPFQIQTMSLQDHLADMLAQTQSAFDMPERQGIQKSIASDARYKLSRQDCYVGVHSDGWISPGAVLRMKGWRTRVVLECENGRSDGKAMTIDALGSWGGKISLTIVKPGPFTIDIAVPEEYANSNISLVFRSKDYFIPSEMLRGSVDSRPLLFKVVNVL